jgi:hypothetical protein
MRTGQALLVRRRASPGRRAAGPTDGVALPRRPSTAFGGPLPRFGEDLELAMVAAMIATWSGVP